MPQAFFLTLRLEADEAEEEVWADTPSQELDSNPAAAHGDSRAGQSRVYLIYHPSACCASAAGIV